MSNDYILNVEIFKTWRLQIAMTLDFRDLYKNARRYLNDFNNLWTLKMGFFY